MFCFNCHRLLFTPFNVEIYIAQLRALDLGLDYILDDILQYANDISQSTKGFDWSSFEGKTFLRTKLTTLINSECRNQKKKNGYNYHFSNLFDGCIRFESNWFTNYGGQFYWHTTIGKK